MAFENNQQDAFNLRNDTENLKLFQSELDKATMSIGAAEMAAEEELAKRKLKNLNELQKAKIQQLDRLIAQEEAGIRDLANARLTLSDKQFELRKKEIQKEFQLAKDAAEELLKITNKKNQASAKRPASSAKENSPTSKAKQTTADSGKTNNLELINLVSSIDQTLGSLHSTVADLSKAKNKDNRKESKAQNTSPSAAKDLKTNISTNVPTNVAKVPPDGDKPIEVKSEEPKERNFTDSAKGLKEVDLGKHSFESVSNEFDNLKKSLAGKDNAQTRKDLDAIVKKGEKAPQASIDAAGDLLKSIEAANDAEQKLKEFNEASVLTKRLRAADAEHQLRKAHADEARGSAEKAEAISAKTRDLEINRQKYIDEEKQALENSFAEKRNALTTEYIKSEEARAYALAHKKELLDLEGQKLRNEHSLAAYKAETARNSAAAKAEDLKNNDAKYFQEAYWAQEQAYADNQNKLNEERINTEAALTFALTHEKELLEQEAQKLENAHANANLKAILDNIAAEAEAKDLEHNRALYAQEEDRALRIAQLKEQNKLAKEQIAAEAKLKAIENNNSTVLNQEAHKLRIGHIEAEHKAMEDLIAAQAKKDDLEANRKKYLTEAEQALKVGHENKQNDLTLAGINAEAKAKDLVKNKEQYILEARQARENAFYEEQNKLAEERYTTEAEIAWERTHSEELMAQELQQKRLSGLKEYQEYQKKAGKYSVSQEKFEKDKARKDNKAARKEAVGGITDGLKKFGTGEFSMTDIKKSYGEYMNKRTAELKDSGLSDSSAKLAAQFELLAEAAGGLQAVLDADVKKISSMQGIVDTRLQGSQVNELKGNSYWKQLLKDAKGIAGASPFIRQETLVDNIKTLVEKGISFDVKQRAFLMTIQEKIANTFNVADGTLLRLIRIQQQDTTAGRLGMETALNSFLNSMYETSEYLENVAASVRSSLEEMQALMDGAAATEVEYQVQKWMGSLYSVGMSDSAVQGIAQALGQIASGDISGITGNGTGNLLIMAANEAGKSIADILQTGLDATETNELMQAMVNYLAEIAETSNDSKVVQQQLANVYGLKASDLKAATNLASSVKDVSKQNLAYSGMLGQLQAMMNTLNQRTSISEGMTNMWDNVMYSMASTQASNPILYALPKLANLLRDVTGGSGIDLPFINVFGFGVDLNTSIADLMSIASMAGTALGALGPLFTGLSDLTNSSVGASMLNRAGIKTSGKAPVIARGSAQPLQNLGGASISESGYVGNSSGEDIKKATLQDAEDDKKKQMVKAREEEETDEELNTKADMAMIGIYNLLEEAVHGSQTIRVKVVGGGCNCNCGSTGVKSIENETPSTKPNETDNGNWVIF